MLIHQIHNSLNSKLFNIVIYRNVDYTPHLHRGYEFIFVLEGTLRVVDNNREFHLIENEAILISPYHIHSFHGKGLFLVAVFSGANVESFSLSIEGKVTERPVFWLPPHVRSFVEASFLGHSRETKKYLFLPNPDALTLKATLYAICAEYVRQCEFSEQKAKEQSWLLDALLYIEKNFTSNITLYGMAKELGYNYEYLSREFNRVLGVSFKTLLNQYRCERARHLIETTNETLTAIAERSGFQSIRSFNRVFKEQLGILPSELKRHKDKKISDTYIKEHRSK